METRELIRSLAAETRPVPSGAALGRLLAALALGGVAVLALIAAFIGDPFLGLKQLGAITFGLKLAFTASLLLLSLVLLYRSGQPGQDVRVGVAWLGAPVALMAVIAAIALVQAPAEAQPELLFGRSWSACLTSIGLLAIPVFALLVRAFRNLAPTDLRLAGMLAGLASGSAAALVYGLHCAELSPVFLFVWYGLAIAVAAIVGRLAGPLLLKW